MPSPSDPQDKNGAEDRLRAMGYNQELPRSLSMIKILGLSFAIMGIPCGLSVTMSIGLIDGGPVTIFWGWIIVSLISLCIAASLAEICSVFPTSGGVYFWAHLLSPPQYAPVASWITGWLGLVGNITAMCSLNFALVQLILASVSLWQEDFVAEPWLTVLCFWGLMIIFAAINILGSKWLDKLNIICMYWTGFTVVVILIVLLSKSKPSERHTAKYVFTEFDPTPSGWPSGWAFFVGLLQAAYTMNGYGMVASLAEEVQNPEREVPRAMVLSVAAAAVTGIIFLVPILIVLPDISTLLLAPLGQPMPALFKEITGSAGGGFGLLILLLGIFFFAGVGCLTATSRSAWAFSRDGAIPFSRYWSKVDERFEVPVKALLLVTVLDCLLALIYFGSSAAFNAFTGVATICLSVSYGVPVLISVLRGRVLVRNAPFSLGKFGYLINGIAITWIMFAIVLFSVPTAIPVTAATMNYASVVFAFFALVSVIWYVVWGKENYRGPTATLVGMGLAMDSNETVSTRADGKGERMEMQ